MKPKIQIRMDLSPEGVRNVLVFADTPEDREMALGWLSKCLVQIELLEVALKQCSDQGTQ